VKLEFLPTQIKEEQMNRGILMTAAAVGLSIMTVGCATLTNDPMTPVAISFSDGSNGACVFENKRGTWPTPIPVTVAVRRSDDPLRWRCKTDDGRETTGSIPSTMDAKIVASAVFIDFGITDAITDKHRQYPASFVIPIPARTQAAPAAPATTETPTATPAPGTR
jgi:hypothetical protein